MKKIGLILVCVLFLGVFSGFLSSNSYAVRPGVDCCTACRDFCGCENGSQSYYDKCYTVACNQSPGCQGDRLKCCWPDY